MSDIIDINDIDDDYSGSLEIVVTHTVKSKESIRKELEDDIETFLKNGGKIDYVESKPFVQNSRAVGFIKEGMTGYFSGFSRDSI